MHPVLIEALRERAASGHPVKVALVGAGRFGTTVAAQLSQVKALRLSVVYNRDRDRFLINNIREPACVDVLSAATLAPLAVIPVGAPGPHGLDLDESRQRAFVACDSGVVVVLDLGTGEEIVTIPITGEPDAIWSNRVRDKLYVAISSTLVNNSVLDRIMMDPVRVYPTSVRGDGERG